MASLALRHNEPFDAGIRRIAQSLIDDALWRLEHEASLGRAPAVHQSRKRCKEFRGLARLVRAGIGEDAYYVANGTSRDAARLLANMRDRHAMLGTFDSLIDAVAGAIPAPGVGGVRSGLRRQSMRASRPSEDQLGQIDGAHKMLVAVRDSIQDWDISHNPSDVIEAGISRTYARARRAMKISEDTMDPHEFHEWRKRVKYGWYHAEILMNTAPGVLGPMARMRHRLSDGLGDAHDLTVIMDTVEAAPDEFGGVEQVEVLEAVMGPVRNDLERASLLVGRRLYVEDTTVHARRMIDYLETWHTHGDEHEIGEIARLWKAEDDHLDDFSVDELRARAAELEVRGRWSMDRRALLRALRATGESSRGPDRRAV
ncbi:MAG: CHAD domain-containing protein [Acidimicrobiia bacterium]|nr:CHAD domain-containing protein [Acidimicrobiia bacterium]